MFFVYLTLSRECLFVSPSDCCLNELGLIKYNITAATNINIKNVKLSTPVSLTEDPFCG